MANESISTQALKVARRLDGLPNNRFYTIQLVKTGGTWQMAVSDPSGTAVETVTGAPPKQQTRGKRQAPSGYA